jgi:hypothetical protein
LAKKENHELESALNRTDIKRKDLKAELISLKYSLQNQPDSLILKPGEKQYEPVKSMNQRSNSVKGLFDRKKGITSMLAEAENL